MQYGNADSHKEAAVNPSRVHGDVTGRYTGSLPVLDLRDRRELGRYKVCWDKEIRRIELGSGDVPGPN